MNARRLAAMAIVAVVVGLGQAYGAVTNVTVYPNSTYLWDGSAAVGVPGDFPAGFGSGSFQANGTSYSKYGFNTLQLQQMLGYVPTIGEIQSISYYTKNNLTSESAGDWFVQMYTVKQASGNYGSWYHDILNAEPYLADNINAPKNTWNQWQTGSGPNELTFGINANHNGAYGDPVLSSVTSNPLYETQQILYLSLATGSGWANGFTGEVDGLSVTLANPQGGTDTMNVNFEAATPEPATMVVWGLLGLLAGVYGARRRRAR